MQRLVETGEKILETDKELVDWDWQKVSKNLIGMIQGEDPFIIIRECPNCKESI